MKNVSSSKLPIKNITIKLDIYEDFIEFIFLILILVKDNEFT